MLVWVEHQFKTPPEWKPIGDYTQTAPTTSFEKLLELLTMIQIVFVLLYLVDAVVNIVSLLAPAFADFSALSSGLLFIVSIVILVMSISGKCQPKSVFLTLSAYYVGLGAVWGAILFVLVEDPSVMDNSEAMLAFLESFSWWVPTIWTTTVIQLALGIYGVKKYSSH